MKLLLIRLRNLFSDKGLILCFALSAFFLVVFFGKLLLHPNTVYFNADGDGMLVYYNSIWHVKNDASFLKDDAMNYPYGENVFFAACQSPVTNTIKLISKVVDISDYTVGITNLSMLFSIVLSAIFLYLIFRELRIHFIFGAVCATAIAFLSPQIARLAGHYSLTYQFALPAFLYLLIKFWQQPSMRRSLGIALLVFLMAFIQLYFFAFFGVIALVYWGVLFILRDRGFGRIVFVLKHVFIQIILPFVLLQITILLVNHATDRTNTPWGILVYKSTLNGVFFPFSRPFEDWVRMIYTPSDVQWEGESYIGIAATICFFILALGMLRHFLNKDFRKIFTPTDNRLLNIFFLAALAAFFYSLGYLFMLFGPNLIRHLGFLKQIRAIGRFAWVFYYIMNIICVYLAFRAYPRTHKVIRYSFMTLVTLLICYDAWYNVRYFQNTHNNYIEELSDKDNHLPQDEWLRHIKSSDYQAIIPLPYLHVGSENAGIEPQGDIEKILFIVSLKTKLPTTAFHSSRISLSQTYNNISLFLEPNGVPQILNDIHDERPFLLVVDEAHVKPAERPMLNAATLLFKTPSYQIYRLESSRLKELYKDPSPIAWQSFQKTKKYEVAPGVYSTDSIKRFVRLHYDENSNPESFAGKGTRQCLAKDYCIAYEAPMPNGLKDQDYVFTIWMKDIRKDLYARTTVEIATSDSTGQLHNAIYTKPSDLLRGLRGEWALLEGHFRLVSPKDNIKVTFWSEEMAPDAKITLDEFLALPVKDTLFEIEGEQFKINNRIYKKP